MVVFDMAGTTVHDENHVHLALQKALQKNNIETSIEEINEVMGYPKPEAIRILLDKKLFGKKQITLGFIEEIHQVFLDEMIHFYQFGTNIKEKKGASKVFDTLRQQGIKVVLDTGFSRDIADTILDRLEWHELIDGSITSDEVANGRPYPDMIFKAMEKMGITDAKQVAKVGDTESDLLEGTAAGCSLVIGVTTGAFSRKVLSKSPHTHLIEDLEELLGILGIHQDI